MKIICKMAKSKLLLDVEKIRKDFPILDVKVHGKPLVYLDNAATTQKPKLTELSNLPLAKQSK